MVGGGAIFLLAFFYPNPQLALGENGKLGPVSSASSQLMVVVPEHFNPLKVQVQGHLLRTCGYISKDVTFLSINGDSTELLQPKKGVSDCENGETYIAPVQKGGVSIFVPSST